MQSKTLFFSVRLVEPSCCALRFLGVNFRSNPVLQKLVRERLELESSRGRRSPLSRLRLRKAKDPDAAAGAADLTWPRLAEVFAKGENGAASRLRLLFLRLTAVLLFEAALPLWKAFRAEALVRRVTETLPLSGLKPQTLLQTETPQ